MLNACVNVWKRNVFSNDSFHVENDIFSLLLKNVFSLIHREEKIGFLSLRTNVYSVHKDALRKEARQRALFSVIQYFDILDIFSLVSSVRTVKKRKKYFAKWFKRFLDKYLNIQVKNRSYSSMLTSSANDVEVLFVIIRNVFMWKTDRSEKK